MIDIRSAAEAAGLLLALLIAANVGLLAWWVRAIDRAQDEL